MSKVVGHIRVLTGDQGRQDLEAQRVPPEVCVDGQVLLGKKDHGSSGMSAIDTAVLHSWVYALPKL